MKKLLSTMLLVLFTVLAQAQVDTLLNENFDGGTTNMTSHCLPVGGGGGWSLRGGDRLQRHPPGP